MTLAALTLPTWDTLTEEQAREAVRAIETPRARFVKFERHAQGGEEHRVAVFDVDGVEMVLVPGGRVTLGFDVERLNDTAIEAWARSFREQGHLAQQVLGGPDVNKPPPDEMVSWLKSSMTPLRDVEVRPFLLERASTALNPKTRAKVEGDDDPHFAIATAVANANFRLPTSDEWEHAVSGGTRSIFRWGDHWPYDTDVWDGGAFTAHKEANAFGLFFSADPYQSELVDDPEELRGGDGGCMVCGQIGPMAWASFASAYRYRLKFEDGRDTWFDQTHPRRALSIATEEAWTPRRYVLPSELENAEYAAFKLRDALEDHEELVVAKDDREELLEELPDLDALRAAHPNDDDVQILLSHAYRKLGRFADAERAIGSVLARRRDTRTLVTLAAVHQARGDVDRAVALFDEAAAPEPSPDSAHMLREHGRFAEAAERYQRIHELYPDLGWATVYALYTRAKAHGDTAARDELMGISEGPAIGVDWIEALANDLRAKGPRRAGKKKTAAKKKAATKKKTTKKAATKKKTPVKKKPATPKKRAAAKKKAGATATRGKKTAAGKQSAPTKKKTKRGARSR